MSSSNNLKCRYSIDEGELVFDASKPDGTPQKLLDVSLLNELGWIATVSLEKGLQKTYEWFKK